MLLLICASTAVPFWGTEEFDRTHRPLTPDLARWSLELLYRMQLGYPKMFTGLSNWLQLKVSLFHLHHLHSSAKKSRGEIPWVSTWLAYLGYLEPPSGTWAVLQMFHTEVARPSTEIHESCCLSHCFPSFWTKLQPFTLIFTCVNWGSWYVKLNSSHLSDKWAM